MYVCMYAYTLGGGGGGLEKETAQPCVFYFIFFRGGRGGGQHCVHVCTTVHRVLQSVLLLIHGTSQRSWMWGPVGYIFSKVLARVEMKGSKGNFVIPNAHLGLTRAPERSTPPIGGSGKVGIECVGACRGFEPVGVLEISD